MPDKYRLRKGTFGLEGDLIFTPVSALAYANILYDRWHLEISKDLIENNPEWFTKVEEKLYTEEDMRKCYERGWQCGAVAFTTSGYNKEFCRFETFMKELQSKDR